MKEEEKQHSSSSPGQQNQRTKTQAASLLLKGLRVLWKVLKGAISTLVLLLFLSWLLFKMPIVQNYLAKRATHFLSKELETIVSIDKVEIQLFDKAVFKGVYIEDLHKDTLLYGQELSAYFDISKAMKGTFLIEEAHLHKGYFQFNRFKGERQPNIYFILNYLAGEKKEKKKKKKPKIQLDIQHVHLLDARFSLRDEIAGTAIKVHVPQGHLHSEGSNLLTQLLHCDQLNMDRPSVKIHVFEGSPMPPNPNPGNGPPRQAPKWTIKAKKIRMNNMHFELRNDKVGVKPDLPLDFSDLQLSNSNFWLDSLQLQNDSLFAKVLQLSAKDKRGFQIDTLYGDVFVSPKGAHLKNFQLRTPNSKIGDELVFIYKQFPDFLDFVHKVELKARVNASRIAIADIMAFAAPLNNNPFFIHNKDKVVETSFRFRGAIEDFSIKKLVMDVGDTHVEGVLDLKPFEKRMYIKAEPLNTNYADIKSILGFIQIPSELSRLGNLNFKGKFSGFFDNDFNAKGDLRTRLGRVKCDLGMNLNGGAKYAEYDGNLSLFNFDLGTFLNQRDIGYIDTYTNLKGKGLTAETIDAIVDTALVNVFEFKGYRYDTIQLNAVIQPGFIKANVELNDPHAAADLQGTLDLNGSLPSLKLEGAVDHIQFKDLNLTPSVFSVGAKRIYANLKGDKIDNFSGKLLLGDLLMEREWGKYFVNDFALNAQDSVLQNGDTARAINLNSDFISGVIWGAYDEVNLPKSLFQFAEKNYPNLIENLAFFQAIDSSNSATLVAIDEADSTQQIGVRSIPDQTMHIDLIIDDTKNLTELINKDFKQIKGAYIKADFDSQQDSFYLDVNIDKIQWGDLEIHTERLIGAGKSNQFRLRNELDYLQLNDSTPLPTPVIELRAYGDSLVYDITAEELGQGDLAQNIQLKGQIAFLKKAIRTSLSNSRVTILGQDWFVKGKNSLLFDFENKTLDVKALRLMDSAAVQTVVLSSIKDKMGRDRGIEVNVKRFDLGWLYDQVRIPIFDVDGTLNANIRLYDVFTQDSLWVKVDFMDLSINGDDWDRARLILGASDLKSPIIGHFDHAGPMVEQLHTDFTFTPAYATDRAERKNYINLEIDALNARASILEYFMPGQLINTEGFASAKGVKIYGQAPKLFLRGDARLRDVATTVGFLNVRYRLGDAGLKLRNKALSFTPDLRIDDESVDCPNCIPIRCSNEKVYKISGGVPIVDEEGNTGYIGGAITHDHLKDWGIDLDIIMNNNLALNTDADSDMPFYGKVYASGKANFLGPFSKMKLTVEGRTSSAHKNGQQLAEKSVLVLPITDPVEINQAVDFLVFVDKKAQQAALENGNAGTTTVSAGGIDIDMKINATPDAVARLIIDEKAGDIIEGRGDGDLHLTYSAAGELDLRGLFAIKEGNYLFTYRNLINKKFEVDEGGTIRWSGDPFNAEIDLRAKYTQSTALYNLLLSYQEELQSSNLENAANKPVNVDVIMNMKGSLMKPDISFGLELAEQIEGKLGSLTKLALRAIQRDETKLNRQVFALIALQQFLPEESAGGNPNWAASSVNTLSELVTQQFSRHISDLLSEVVQDVDFISNVDFDFDYRLDENQQSSSSTGSQINVQLDNYFFKDRLRVQVGANVDFNSQTTLGTNQNYIGGDFIIEYELTPSGNLKMRAYGRSESDIFGPRFRTGIGLSYEIEFDSFRDRKSKAKRKMRRFFKEFGEWVKANKAPK